MLALADGKNKEFDKRTLSRTLNTMTTITATNARNKLYNLIDEANTSHIPIQITGKRGNAVLVSEHDWKAISETIHLSAIPGMVDSIKEGMNEKIEDCSDTIEW
jgi:prevent-host-death family protein